MLSQYFVEFIFYSFLGWVWESIYCTIQEKKWADRGFLFGPICPIYGSCVIIASFVFTHVPVLSDPNVPIPVIMLVCGIGSAIAEFGTSWVLEKRFHARWWDYSDMPFNLQGRICLPVSFAFGLAGIFVVKFLVPAVNHIHQIVPMVVYELFALIFAMCLGADYALTEVSLSKLIKEVEQMHEEFNIKAQANYEKLSQTPSIIEKKVQSGVETVSAKISTEKAGIEEKIQSTRKEITEAYIKTASITQKSAIGSIQKFTFDPKEAIDKRFDRQTVLEDMQKAMKELREKKNKK